ncbi:hypothetical protein [Butyrivibrio proteoclasticus]|uniref:hypothetical protein n=1 Tax=Butyrivibrio proteoclasticus TaxID=43305 RepID=UPI00047BC43E|nr:hypothetical protein [Butyrivibrio proteoclasticus]
MRDMVFKENTKEAYRRVRIATVAVVCGLSGSCFMYLKGESLIETIINYLSFFSGISFITIIVLFALRNKIVVVGNKMKIYRGIFHKTIILDDVTKCIDEENKLVLLVGGNEIVVDINLFQDPDGIREVVKANGIAIERMYS